MKLDNAEINTLLWPFLNLPEKYVVIDTESTGLFDEQGAPGIITIGVAQVNKGSVQDVLEVQSRPHRPLKKEASLINGFNEKEVSSFQDPHTCWSQVEAFVQGQLLVVHNAAFDWTLLQDHIQRYELSALKVAGVFCSQRAAQPWAESVGIKCSSRGPSLDSLTKILGVKDLRDNNNNIHYASKDAIQTASVIKRLIKIADGEK